MCTAPATGTAPLFGARTVSAIYCFARKAFISENLKIKVGYLPNWVSGTTILANQFITSAFEDPPALPGRYREQPF
jgi:hypothetical protein